MTTRSMTSIDLVNKHDMFDQVITRLRRILKTIRDRDGENSAKESIDLSMTYHVHKIVQLFSSKWSSNSVDEKKLDSYCA